MADSQRKIMAELEQIELTIAKLPECPLSELNELELLGVGGIFSFSMVYNLNSSI